MISKQIVRSIPKLRFIKNMNFPACENCLYFGNFIPIEGSHYEYSKIGVCMKFGDKNMITGKIDYDSAINCRNDPSKCSNEAFHFTPL
jgi:hypothetical protein